MTAILISSITSAILITFLRLFHCCTPHHTAPHTESHFHSLTHSLTLGIPGGIASEIAKSALFGAAKLPTVTMKAFLLSDICINYAVGRRERRGAQKCNKNPSIPPPSFATSTNGWRLRFRLGNLATAVIRPNFLLKKSTKYRETVYWPEHLLGLLRSAISCLYSILMAYNIRRRNTPFFME